MLVTLHAEVVVSSRSLHADEKNKRTWRVQGWFETRFLQQVRRLHEEVQTREKDV